MKTADNSEGRCADIAGVLNRPIVIGGRTVPNRLFLAPMAGLTHVAFRELVAEYGGCGLLFSEMCSARTVPTENRHVSTLFRWRDAELPALVCQIVGAAPPVMAAAARRIAAEGFFGVDINFGCSVSAICKQQAGAAVLRDPDRAVAIVRAVREAVCLPVFVKYRIGWTDDPQPAVDLARRFEDAGADALTFHPRVAPDRRSRPPKWPYIGRVKQAVTIPVFGNGEVFDPADAARMAATTGCDGISIGRIALARPWVFAEWLSGFRPDADVHRSCAHRLMDLTAHHYEAVTAVRRFKKWAAFFTAAFRFGHTFYAHIRRAADIRQIHAVIDDFFDQDPELAGRPNMNQFR